MNPIWILAYLIVTVSSSGRISYEAESLEMELSPCFELMLQLDEVYAPFDKSEYKKYVELSCKIKDTN